MGGDSGASDAAKQANTMEAQRQADIKATQQRIDSIFSAPGRERDIQSVIDATRAYLGDALKTKNLEAQRQTKFALARNGQTGGSYDVDTHRKLGNDFLKAALEVERRSQQAGTGLRNADQQAKMNLFSLATQGLDSATAMSQAAQSMRVDLANARQSANEDGLGDFFGNLGDVYKTSKEAAGARQAERYQYGTFYAPSGGASNGWGG